MSRVFALSVIFSFFPVPSIRTRIERFSLGASWVFSFQKVLLPDKRPLLPSYEGSWARTDLAVIVTWGHGPWPVPLDHRSHVARISFRQAAGLIGRQDDLLPPRFGTIAKFQPPNTSRLG